MLYLAEIQKQSKGFMGGVETKLKLIACQRNDQSWSIISNESITLEETNDFYDGALIVVNLGANRQIQGQIELASQKIIGVLKNFSRLLEKTKDQEQEISQWKESLAIQSEELSRRQIEMETRLEQVEQMEEEFKQFEQQRQEIAAAKADTDQIRAEFEAKSAELQGAWEQLRGEQRNLEEQVSQSKILDDEQANIIKQQLAILTTASDTSNLLSDKLNLTAEAIAKQQELLQPHWQNLQQNSEAILTKRQDLERIAAELAAKQQQVSSLVASIAAAEQQLGIELKSLEVKQELTRFLNLQSEAQDNMLQMLAGSESDSGNGQKLDIQELENMPLPNLETIVESLKKDLEKVARFVNDQEEELGWQCKAVEELEAKIAQVGEFERLTLEQELADEKEAKKMLDQTLVGQRRSLKERHQVLLQHSRVLKRRQGIIDFDFDSEIQDIDLEPIKQGLEEQHQKLQQQQQELAEEVAQIEQSIQRLEANLEQQKHQKSQLESEIAQQQDSWNELNLSIVKQQSQIDFYEQQLQPLQDALDRINHEVSEMQQLMGTYLDSNPSNAVTKIEDIITDLTAT
ncbi:pilus motility taxis protein HmpF [Pleurocapsa sp. PCC 7319]|uniref:pilus motility taxis protein HmpF n=1 Tax=Pleurocapsa sp. PCC 7319 TaxID=118161 RepID=UPI000347E21F|nr:pilus motility taxis protein HmpF [Pleurocapsa sp. PCC 7319]